MNDDIKEIRKKALDKNIPIMQDEGIEFLLNFIKNNNLENILEVGTAVGYSAIRMASISPLIKVTSIERDSTRYMEAVKNIAKEHLEDRITLIFKDAIEVEFDKNTKFDLIDAFDGPDGAVLKEKLEEKIIRENSKMNNNRNTKRPGK